jgi:hypothetical protein
MEKDNGNNVNVDNSLHENAPRMITMNESIYRIVRTYIANRNGIIDIPADVKAQFRFVASKHGPVILMHLYKYRSLFALELINLYNLRRQNVYDIISNLELIGLIEEIGSIKRDTGGRTSPIYAFVGSEIDVLEKAQSRYKEMKNTGDLVKKNLDHYQERDQIQRDYNEQLDLENQEAKRANIIAMLETGYVTNYEDTGKPICLRAIEKALRNNNIDTKYVHPVAESLEKQGVLTTYTNRNGEPSPTWTPTPTILAIRAKRSKNQ